VIRNSVTRAPATIEARFAEDTTFRLRPGFAGVSLRDGITLEGEGTCAWISPLKVGKVGTCDHGNLRGDVLVNTESGELGTLSTAKGGRSPSLTGTSLATAYALPRVGLARTAVC